MNKYVTALLCVLVTFCTSFGINVSAAEYDSTTGFYYELDGTNATITGYDISKGTSVTVPPTLTIDATTYYVTKIIGDDSSNSINSLTVDSFVIGSNVTYLDIHGLTINGDFTVPN